MTSTSAQESALSFAALSDSERSEAIRQSMRTIMKNNPDTDTFVDEFFHELAEKLLEIGRVEHYMRFSQSQKTFLSNITLEDIPIEIFFLLDEVKRGLPFTSFLEDRDISLQEFETELVHRFDNKTFRNFGSDEFMAALHQYFVAFGGRAEYDMTTDVTTHYSGLADEFMVLTVLVLKRKYGEKIVIDLLKKVVTDRSPISAADFIKIIKSKIDYSDYPLSWVSSIV